MARAPAALPEGVSESMSAEESQMLADDRANEHAAAPQSEPEATPEPQPEGDAPTAEVVATPEAEVERAKDAAIVQQRERAKAAEKAQREAETKYATLEGRMAVINEMLQRQAQAQAQPQAPQPAAPQVEIPDVNVDPIGHFAARLELSERRAAQMAEQMGQQQQSYQVQNNAQRLGQIAAVHEQEFAQQTPDYYQAAQALRTSRDMELQSMGYTNPVQRQEVINNDLLMIAAHALQGNRNVGEVIYQMSKVRGYQPTAQPVEPTPLAAPANLQAPQAPSAAQKLQTVAKGQEATQSLGQAPGSPMPGPITAERLLNMSEEEFTAATKGGKWRELMENAPRR